MSNAEHRIPVRTLEHIAKERFPNESVIKWFGAEIRIKHSLSLTQMVRFVNEIVDACFTEEGAYTPETMDFMIRRGILTHYANFTLPKNPEQQYTLICSTDAVETVRQHINSDQLANLIDTANQKIQFLCDTSLNALNLKAMELVSAFDRLSLQVSQMFEGVNKDELREWIGTLRQSGAPERKQNAGV